MLSIKKLFILSFLLLPFFSFSQSKENKQIKKQAVKFYRNGDYGSAIEIFQEVEEFYQNDAKFHYMLGISYLHAYTRPKDLEYLEKTKSIDPEIYSDLNYWLGRANHLNYNFVQANQYYQEYIDGLKWHQKNQLIDLENLLEQSKYAKTLCEKPQNYIVEKVEGKINTEYSEHSPITTMDGSTLIYTSRQPNEANNSETNIAGEYLEKIYITTKNDSGIFDEIQLLDLDPEFDNHLATMQLSIDEKKMFLYKSTHNGDIYESNKQGDKWSVPEPYMNANTGSFEADVFVARNQKFMIISSDRNTIDGNLDLLISHRISKDEWGEFIPMPDNINTGFDENSPFISNKGDIIYFSSNGHKSMGGYDVFRTKKDSITGLWGDPENMGYPINTPDDDVYFYFGHNGWIGYTASYRLDGQGEKDIYKITFVPNVNIEGEIIAGNTNEVMKNVDIRFVSINDTIDETDLFTDSDSTFNVNILSNRRYDVIFTRDGDTLDTKKYTVPFLAEGDPIFYNHDFVLFKDDEIEIDSTLPKVNIEGQILAGNTNEIMENVMIRFLATNDTVNETNLLHYNNGNFNVNILSNREYDVIFTRDGDTLDIQKYNTPLLAKEDPLFYTKNFIIYENKEEEPVLASSVETVVEIEEEVKTTAEPEIEEPPIIALEGPKPSEKVKKLGHVYFEFDMHHLQKESIVKLNRLVALLETRNDILVSLVGHADEIGSYNYNLKLGLMRANTVKKYLLDKKIDPEILLVSSKGDAQPLVSNDDETDGREINRRVELNLYQKNQ